MSADAGVDLGEAPKRRHPQRLTHEREASLSALQQLLLDVGERRGGAVARPRAPATISAPLVEAATLFRVG